MAFFANLIGLISFLTVNRIAIFVGEDGNSLGIEFVARAECTDSDLSAVGYQYLIKHRIAAAVSGRVLLLFSQGTSMVFVLSQKVTGAQVSSTIPVMYTLSICDTTHVVAHCKNYVLEWTSPRSSACAC